MAFQKLVYGNDYDVICVTESWLTQAIKDSEILERGYNIFRCDHSERLGGGVLVAVRDSIKCLRRSDLETKDLELVCIELNLLGSAKILLTTVYRTPDSSPSYDFEFIGNFSEFLGNSTRILKSSSIVVGDFNYPCVNWVEECGISNSPNSADFAFCERLRDCSLSQLNTFPTRGENLLDLIITNEPERVINIELLPFAEAGLSTDHHLLEFDVIANHHRVTKAPRIVYNFKAADFDKLRSDIVNCEYLTNSVTDNSNDMDTCWMQWKTNLLRLIDSHIPKIKIRDANTPPWIDKEVRHLLKKKETARRATKKNPDNVRFLKKFSALRKEVKALINAKQKKYNESLGDSLKENPKRFWNYFRSKTKSNSIPANVTYNNETFALGPDKADAFNRFFFSTFTQDSDSPAVGLPLPDPKTSLLECFRIPEEEVSRLLANLDPSKAPGPDSIPTLVLKECASVLAPSVCKLFNLSIEMGIVPSEWKNALVVPVHKKGKKEEVTNYRPISLLCVISKVLERCIYDRLKDHLCALFHHAQHGFLKGRSTVTQLLTFYHEIGQALDKGLQTDIVFLDLAKAFDSVCHQRLIYKLSCYGINGPLLQWFKSYLIGRSQRSIVHGYTSSSLPVVSGVPQGSILGPLLFLAYVNDLPSVVDCQIALFADDSKCAQVVNTFADCNSLQEDLDNISCWSKNWRLKFNSTKCEVLSVGRKRKPIDFPYKLEGSILNNVKKEKDLGVLIRNDLKWSSHIDCVVGKGYKMLGFLRRHSLKSFDTQTRRLLYLSFVRPIVGYASEVWSPQTINDLSKVESLQRRATKFILNVNWNDKISYRDRLVKANLLPLSYWHEYKDLLFYFRCYSGSFNIPMDKFIAVKNTRLTRHSSSLDTLIPKCRTKLFQASFFNRLPKIWNNLSPSVRSANSLAQFKSFLHKHYLTALTNTYDINNFNTWKSVCTKCSSFRNVLNSQSCCF